MPHPPRTRHDVKERQPANGNQKGDSKKNVHQFLFATGIENSYPTISLPDGRTQRVDEMERTRHYEHWREDFELVKSLGIQYLRYGPPYYRTHLAPGRYDWSFADEKFAALREMGIAPIADLCHFGVPDWIGGFQNPDWPALFAEYADAFSHRFPWIRFYTPVNEIMIAAVNSAKNGWWNERLRNDRAFVTAVKNLCKANLLAMRAMLKSDPQLIFIQSEATQDFHPEEPASMRHAAVLNERRFLALDLLYGHSVTAEILELLLDNGWTREEYHWFLDHHVRSRCIMGNDYYATNEHMVAADGSVHNGGGEIFGYYVITHQYYQRYRLPVMHTETNSLGVEHPTHWLTQQWQSLHRLKQDGVPIIGFTWYSLTDQVDWDTSLREYAGRVNPNGLCDLNRQLRPVGKAYRELISKWGDISPTYNATLSLHV